METSTKPMALSQDIKTHKAIIRKGEYSKILYISQDEMIKIQTASNDRNTHVWINNESYLLRDITIEKITDTERLEKENIKKGIVWTDRKLVGRHKTNDKGIWQLDTIREYLKPASEGKSDIERLSTEYGYYERGIFYPVSKQEINFPIFTPTTIKEYRTKFTQEHSI